MKFKIGQIVYFYQITGEYMGHIVAGKITAASKNLETGEVFYTVEVPTNYNIWGPLGPFSKTLQLRADYLYKNKKIAEKEYKEEIVYNNLNEKINTLQRTLDKVYAELTKDDHKGWEGMTLSINNTEALSNIKFQTNDINIEGIGSVKEELENLKKEVNKIKKQIKPKTKKPVKEKKDAK